MIVRPVNETVALKRAQRLQKTKKLHLCPTSEQATYFMQLTTFSLISNR